MRTDRISLAETPEIAGILSYLVAGFLGKYIY